MRARLLLTVALVLGTSCRADRTLTCSASEECVRREVQGECLLPGYCAFGDSDCPTGRRWDSTAGDGLSGACVDSGDGGSGEQNACGGRAILPAAPGSACGKCDSGTYACDGVDMLLCEDELSAPTALVEATASASSTFEGNFAEFGPAKAVDGMTETSWFSDGDNGSEPTVYTWEGQAEECIDKIEIFGNTDHPLYSENFGFASVTVNVKAGAGQTVFTETVELPGTPDPNITVEVGAVGWDVELLFHNNEDPDCGGFAELVVTGLR